jgi:hypothetical protein
MQVFLRIAAVVRHVGPVIPSAVFLEGESTTGYMCWHSGTKNLGFTSHSKDEAIKVKWLAQGHKRGGPNPQHLDHESDTLTTSPRHPLNPNPNNSWKPEDFDDVIMFMMVQFSIIPHWRRKSNPGIRKLSIFLEICAFEYFRWPVRYIVQTLAWGAEPSEDNRT